MNASSPLIRTFRARDARSALTAVKAAFGPDAVIIETREVQAGLFGRSQIEVTAAADASAARPTPAPAPAPRRVERVIGGDDNLDLHKIIEDARRASPPIREPRFIEEAPRERRAPGAEPELGFEARKAFRHLLDRGVEEVLARELLDEALSEGAVRANEILRGVSQALAKTLRAAPPPWGPDARRTIALVGPTGVGKTTAIAKIAARALLETRFKVGLITVDTYRVGASDQLARYGKIMGVPTYVARDAVALADLVLIDTAGRSDAESLDAQMRLVRTVPNVQLHLVMSLATGARELGSVARRYRPYGPERMIFTKLDETEGPGGSLSALAVLSRPVACLCDGQRVPEDIHAVNESELCENLVGITPSGKRIETRQERFRGSSQ